ncbi:TRAP transporter large permease [Mesorhizobium sp. 1B3]|uniref:TRAP transporter large permease n=1 Tax=Mesorhizobium sp. 1B3 TaxID=3243599 RepID=UPI003D95A332
MAHLLGYTSFAFLLLLIALGVPIAWAISIVAFSGMTLLFGFSQAIAQFYTTAFNTAGEFLFASIPLFIYMGLIVSYARIGEDLYDAMYKWFGRLPGGLLVASVVSCTMFGAVTGVSSAAVGTMSKIVLPEMRRYNYDIKMASGGLASAATIAIMIPPSVLLILYGLWTETSIGKLFIAGIVPGLILTLAFSLYIMARCTLSPELGRAGDAFPLREKVQSLLKITPIFVIFGVVIGGLYVGWFTPGEAAAVGVLSTIAVATAMRRLSLNHLWEAAKQTVQLSGMIFAVLISASVLARFLAATQVTSSVIGIIDTSDLPDLVVLLAVLGVLLLLGCVLDSFGMILLTLPFIFPVVTSLGYDPIWFGIILVLMTELALITPPVGMNVFVLAKVDGQLSLGEIFAGVTPFVVITLLVIATFIAFPGIVTWLPSRM